MVVATDLTLIRLPFDFHSTAVQPRYDHLTTFLYDRRHCGLKKWSRSAWLAGMYYITATLMTSGA